MGCGGICGGNSFFNDPVNYALAAKQQAVDSQIDISVLVTSQNATKQTAEALVALIDSAAQLGKELGKGTMFDAIA